MNPLVSTEISESTALIPLIHFSNSLDDFSKIGPIAMNISSMPQVISSKKSRLLISILPDDLEEKRKYIIRLVLEQFSFLYLSDSSERC